MDRGHPDPGTAPQRAAESSEADARREALQSARASARALEAIDEVRRDLGRHLHDRVQTLAIAARQQLHVAATAIGTSDTRAAAGIDEAQRLLADLTTELRDIARGLHPAGLETGLRPALEALARRAPLELVVDELPDFPLGAAVETTIYLMVTEAVNNAAKHAQATRVRVRVHAGATALAVTAADDGVGGADFRDGSGLLGLQDRLTLLSGTLEVDSPPGAGTTLRASIPLAPTRSPHRPYILVGSHADPAVADRAVEQLRSGQKRASLGLAREWATEGGPPRLGQLMPVLDFAGRTRLTVEIVGLDLVRFGELSDETYRACAIDGRTPEERRATAQAAYAAFAPDLAVLFGEPGWTLTDDEPMVVLRHRVLPDGS